MKSKIIFLLILSAMLLTACNSEQTLVDELEETGTSAVQQTAQAGETVTSSAESGSETEYVLGGETETPAETETASETVPQETEEVPQALENASLEVRKIDISSLARADEQISGGGPFFAGSLAAVKLNNTGDGSIRFFDINDLTVKADVTAPEGWQIDNDFASPCIEGRGDVLCKIKLSRFDNENLRDEYAALIVYNDFTTEFDDSDTALSFPAGSYNISDEMYDIVDADSGEVIVEGYDDKSDEVFDSIWHYYSFQIDNYRFVYRIAGEERMPGLGYYDFNEGKAVEIPESKDFLPVGFYNGKLFAEQCVWDGMCQGELYTFDIDTLESEHFMSSPHELEQNDYTEYYMPPSGEYIIASYVSFDTSSPNIVYIISPESGEVLAQQEFGSEYSDLRFFAFIDGSKFAAFNYNTSELVIFDVAE